MLAKHHDQVLQHLTEFIFQIAIAKSKDIIGSTFNKLEVNVLAC